MAATDKKLGVLHEAVANHLIAVIESPGDEGVPASVLAVAVAFLKNNNITASVSANAELSALSEKLAARRRGKLTNAQLDEAAKQFMDSAGLTMQ